jgi:hypothetical protein
VKDKSDLIGPPQLPHLLLEPADLGVVLGRRSRPLPGVNVGLVHPLANHLHAVAELPCDTLHRP